MQKLFVLIALTVCLFGAQVEGFRVYLSAIRLHSDFEGGDIHDMYMYCTFQSGTRKRFKLAGVFRPRIDYVFPGRGILIDNSLKVDEVHTCRIYEIDVFKNAIDLGAEDRVDDFLGFFTVNRGQFVGNRHPILRRDGVVSVKLSCYDC